MKRNSILTVFGILIIYLSASATIINIPGDYETIQEGIDASSDGDTVLVQAGTYEERVNFNGHNIVVGSLFLTTGDSAYIEQTIIDCLYCWNTVTFANGEDENSALVGFSILSTYWYDYNRGIYCDDSSPVIKNNIISGHYIYEPGAGILLRGNSNASIINNTITNNNSSENIYNGGGGICCLDDSSPQIIGNIILDNMSDFGGGIFCKDNASPYIFDNSITGNFAGFRGGGIYCSSTGLLTIRKNRIAGNRALMGGGGGILCSNSSSVISENVIVYNIALDWYPNYNMGGGIYCSSDSASLINNLIRNNESLYGGGVYCRRSNSRFVNNCIVDNTADSLGGAIFCEIGSNLDVINSIIWDNTSPQDSTIYQADSSVITITYSDIQGGWEGEGNIEVYPFLRTDYHLMSTACGDTLDSPCIDAGSPPIIDSLLDCSWGLGTILSDMGAYGGGDSATVGITDHQPRVPDRFALLQNYPNPFNAKTIIRYNLPSDSDVTIEIYDILGRKVETLFDERKRAGKHTIIWDAADIPSGVYFVRLQTDDYSKNIKMVLLK